VEDIIDSRWRVKTVAVRANNLSYSILSVLPVKLLVRTICLNVL
jgi:hypothetical protein